MNTGWAKVPIGRSVLRRCTLIFCAVAAMPAWSGCPKLLFAGGVFIRQDTNAQQAAYWGRTVGVQGFLVNEVMRDWDTDVGTDPDSRLWKLVREFQSTYSREGVTDNFIKVGLYTVHDWRNPWKNQVAATNFAHAAALAKFAGFKGMAVDLESYKPTWGGAAGGPELASVVQQEGRAIGQAMHDAYPDMTLIVEKDVLQKAFLPNRPIAPISDPQAMPPDSSGLPNGGYALAVPFLRGLLSVDWSRVVIATQETYRNPDIVYAVQQTSRNYSAFLGNDAVWTKLSVAPGLWPLGRSSWDKSPRETPAEFKKHLQAAFGVSEQYVWIYGFGSAWQTGGHYAPGPVTSNFQQYLDAVHQVIASCDASDSSAQGQPPAHVVPPRASSGPAQSIGSSQYSRAARGAFPPAGTLPQIRILRAVQGNVATEIP